VSEEDVIPWRIERGLHLRSEARELFATAMGEAAGTDEEREVLARKALSVGTSAFNWLEDSEWEEAAHDELHAMGRRVHELFPAGCHLDWTGERYEHRCPVRLAHKRFGFSPSMRVGKKLCMICGDDVSECPHLPGRMYSVLASRDDEGECSICHRTDCDHQVGAEYMARMSVRITEIVALDHLAIVPRPVQVDNRLSAIPVSNEGLAEALGPEFHPGIELYCSRCELACTGLDRMESDPRLHGRGLPTQRRFAELDSASTG